MKNFILPLLLLWTAAAKSQTLPDPIWIDSLKKMPINQQIRAIKERAILESQQDTITKVVWILGHYPFSIENNHPKQLSLFLEAIDKVTIGEIVVASTKDSPLLQGRNAGVVLIIPKYGKDARRLRHYYKRIQRAS